MSSRLISRQPVTLTKFQAATVARMYNPEVLTETVVERIVYYSGNLRINGYLAYPSSQKKYPVIIWNRGGFGTYGALEDLTAFLILASTAQWGYVLLASQYRGNFGAEGTEDWGGEDVNDSLNLIELAAELDFCDLSKIAIEGASRGGMMTYRALSLRHDFKCAITHAGISDVFRLRQTNLKFVELTTKLFGHLPEPQQEQEMAKRSAVRFVDSFSPKIPLLIMHGTEDKVVPIEQSEFLVAKLGALHIPHTYAPIKGGHHVALRDGSYREIDGLRKKWLQEKLG